MSVIEIGSFSEVYMVDVSNHQKLRLWTMTVEMYRPRAVLNFYLYFKNKLDILNSNVKLLM